jgi:hypothetical protein
LGGLGFDYVDVNPSIQKGVYLALEGAVPIIESASKYKYLTFDNDILIMMVIPAVIQVSTKSLMWICCLPLSRR